MTEQAAFRALADPTRRQILRLVSQDPLTIGEVSERFDMTRAAVRKHLSALSDGGLITIEARGRERVTRINPAGMAPVLDWLRYFDTFWDDRLATLKSAIEKDTR